MHRTAIVPPAFRNVRVRDGADAGGAAAGCCGARVGAGCAVGFAAAVAGDGVVARAEPAAGVGAGSALAVVGAAGADSAEDASGVGDALNETWI